MSDYLIDHALTNVWCTPDQDNQIILKPVKITPDYGVYNTWRLMWDKFYMPVNGVCFHLYQIGQVHPLIVNLFPVVETWTLLSDACNSGNVICDIYTDTGIELPRSNTWYMITSTDNILLAVRQGQNLPFNPITDSIYFRVYKNAYFSSNRATVGDNRVYVEGKTISSGADITAISNSFDAKSQLIGGVYAFCNGYKIGTISPSTIRVGDIVEFVYDSSIDKVVDFRIADLNTFDSVLDNKGKYLLHYQDIDNSCISIDYRDDIDVFVINSTTNTGVYYHKNMNDSLRMVTHRDYSIPVSNVAYYLNKHATVLNSVNSFIRLHIRKSGYLRPFVDEHNRIKELYKMEDSQVIRALLGLDSTVINWKAATLENSEYTSIMDAKYNDVTKSLVSAAYGYNAVSKLVADTPVHTEMYNSQLIARIPYLFRVDSVAFEYDTDGKLLEYHRHHSGEIYNCTNALCKYVEMIHGTGGNTLDEYRNEPVTTINPNYDYRFYSKLHPGAGIVSEWVDSTGSGRYLLNNNQVTWYVSNTSDTLIRSNNKFLLKEYDTLVTDGLFEFNISTDRIILGDNNEEYMEIPMGELDIFLNGYHLTENLDYFVAFPRVVIVCKDRFVGDPLSITQKVIIRHTGFCDANFKKTTIAEFGYIRNGVISNNDKYNIRDDKVIGIYIDGKMYTKDEVSFNEYNPNFQLDNVLNGKPYIIKDTVVPVKSLTGIDTYDYRNRSLAVDNAISGYLTLRIPEVDPNTLNPIDAQYVLFSPFIAKILFDLRDDILTSPLIQQRYDDDQLRELIAPYLSILKLDPIYVDNEVSREYVKIHPHHLNTVVRIDIFKYTFMKRVVQLYGRGLVDLSPFVQVTEAEEVTGYWAVGSDEWGNESAIWQDVNIEL